MFPLKNLARKGLIGNEIVDHSDVVGALPISAAYIGLLRVSHAGLVTAYGVIELKWNDVDLQSVRSSDIHLKAISQEISQPSTTEVSFKMTRLKFHLNLPGVSAHDRDIIHLYHNMVAGKLTHVIPESAES